MNARLDKLIELRKNIDAQIFRLKVDLQNLNVEINEELDKEPDRRYSNKDYSVSVVTKNRTEYDWDGLRKTVGALKWKQITSLQPDEELLSQAIANGDILASVVAKFQTKTPLSSSVTIRRNGGNQ